MFKKLFDKTFLRFILVGMINTLFGTSVMFIFYNVFHFGYWFSTTSNYVLGSILSYFLNKYFTFKTKKISLSEILRFVTNIAVCYFVAYGLTRPLIKWLLSDSSVVFRDNVTMLAGMGVFVMLNYFGQRFFTFKK